MIFTMSSPAKRLLFLLIALAMAGQMVVFAQYYGSDPSKTRPPTGKPSSLVLPRICKDNVLKPAIRCGCWAYSGQYIGITQWKRLENRCRKLLGGKLTSGRRDCPKTSFSKGRTGQNVNIKQMDKFFLQARKKCVTRRGFRLPSEVKLHQDALLNDAKLPHEIVPTLRMNEHEGLIDFCLISAINQGVPTEVAFDECCPDGAR